MIKNCHSLWTLTLVVSLQMWTAWSRIEFSSRLLNGVKSHPDQWKFMAAIYSEKQKRPYCSGSVIAKDTILTAAHCITKTLTNDLVMVGHSNWLNINNDYMFRIKKSIKHERYFVSKQNIAENDIALIKLKKNIRFNYKVRPIRLFTLNQTKQPLNKLVCKNLGFGSIKPDQPESNAGFLYETDLKVLDNCYQAHYPKDWGIGKVCQLGSRTNFEMGDFGGPLICIQDHTPPSQAKHSDYRQLGVQSGGLKVKESSGSIVNYLTSTDIRVYHEWITKHVKEFPNKYEYYS